MISNKSRKLLNSEETDTLVVCANRGNHNRDYINLFNINKNKSFFIDATPSQKDVTDITYSFGKPEVDQILGNKKFNRISFIGCPFDIFYEYIESPEPNVNFGFFEKIISFLKPHGYIEIMHLGGHLLSSEYIKKVVILNIKNKFELDHELRKYKNKNRVKFTHIFYKKLPDPSIESLEIKNNYFIGGKYKNRKIRIGQRGGRYIILNGKKKYF